jgi:hypothetical protein
MYDDGARNKKSREGGDRHTKVCQEGKIAKEQPTDK